MKKVGLIIAGLLVLASILACSLPAANPPAPAQAATVMTNDPQTVDKDTFRSAISTAVGNTINWWNTGDDSISPDIPQSGLDACVEDLVSSWCSDDGCEWPGTGIELGGYSEAHDAAESCFTAATSITEDQDFLGDRFINYLKDELKVQRESLGIPQE